MSFSHLVFPEIEPPGLYILSEIQISLRAEANHTINLFSTYLTRFNQITIHRTPLDLVLTNRPDLIKKLSIVDGVADHNTIVIDINISPKGHSLNSVHILSVVFTFSKLLQLDLQHDLFAYM